MRFRKIQRSIWWWLGELCEVLRCLLWKGLRCHCPMYNVFCIFFNKCQFFIVHGWILSGQTSYSSYSILHPNNLNLIYKWKFVSLTTFLHFTNSPTAGNCVFSVSTSRGFFFFFFFLVNKVLYFTKIIRRRLALEWLM